MTASRTLIAGRYLLQEPLGQGGMGRVWLGEDEVLHRSVAVKEVVAPRGLTVADLEELRPRALREARAAARLNHPNVVRVYDIVVTDAAPWIVMEYLPSRSLYKIVAEEGPISPARAAQIGLGVLAALTAVHRVGVLHRDVKPGNVLITDDDRVVLTDFGLATIVGDPSVTQDGVLIGSPSFMAPERAADAAVGLEADLWSLGATLYFAVEGRSPYERSSMMATLAALANEDPPHSQRSGPLWPVLEGLLRRDPDARLGAAAVERTLRAIAGPPPARVRASLPAPAAGEATAQLPDPEYAVPARRTPIIAIVVLALLAGLTIWLVPLSRGTSDASEPGISASAAPTTPILSATTTDPVQPTSAPPSAAEPPAANPALVLPPGWHMYTDVTGFSVAVPQSWAVSRRGSIVYFSEPGGGRLLGIDQTDTPEPDPVADWSAKEEYRVARGDFPDYRRVRLVAVDYFVKAADWEFTYLRNGVRVHVNNRGFIVSPRRAYGMWWSTPDSLWNTYLPDLHLIQRSFRPAA